MLDLYKPFTSASGSMPNYIIMIRNFIRNLQFFRLLQDSAIETTDTSVRFDFTSLGIFLPITALIISLLASSFSRTISILVLSSITNLGSLIILAAIRLIAVWTGFHLLLWRYIDFFSAWAFTISVTLVLYYIF